MLQIRRSLKAQRTRRLRTIHKMTQRARDPCPAYISVVIQLFVYIFCKMRMLALPFLKKSAVYLQLGAKAICVCWLYGQHADIRLVKPILICRRLLVMPPLTLSLKTQQHVQRSRRPRLKKNCPVVL